MTHVQHREALYVQAAVKWQKCTHAQRSALGGQRSALGGVGALRWAPQRTYKFDQKVLAP